MVYSNRFFKISSSEQFIVPCFADDEAIAIAYKEEGSNASLSLKSSTYRIMAKRFPHFFHFSSSKHLQSKENPEDKTSYTGLSLVPLEGGRWAIYDPMTHKYFKPEAREAYIFVTMPDKTIRIAPRVKGGHAALSSYSYYIRYAGEIIFDEHQKIASWNNQSGGYYPPPFLAQQAGLGTPGIKRFNAIYDRNKPSLTKYNLHPLQYNKK